MVVRRRFTGEREREREREREKAREREKEREGEKKVNLQSHLFPYTLRHRHITIPSKINNRNDHHCPFNIPRSSSLSHWSAAAMADVTIWCMSLIFCSCVRSNVSIEAISVFSTASICLFCVHEYEEGEERAKMRKRL